MAEANSDLCDFSSAFQAISFSQTFFRRDDTNAEVFQYELHLHAFSFYIQN